MSSSTSSTSKPTVGHSYDRISTKKQERGDGLDRQSRTRQELCTRHGITLKSTFVDAGVSARLGKNATHGKLKAFLDAIKSGAVKPGEALIVESVDRLSRQGIDEGYDLLKKILKAGVWIITVSPERFFAPDSIKGLAKGALELQLILERAHEENEMRSKRILEDWESIRAKARDGKTTSRDGGFITHRCPLWLEFRGGRLRLLPERAEVVKHIFELAAGGCGAARIVKTLTREHVPAFQPRGWNATYVKSVLNDRRALGEFQPRSARQPQGGVIRDHYPAVVTEREFLLARVGAAQRRVNDGKGSRDRKHVNIFAGLLRCQADGEGFQLLNRGTKGQADLILANAAGLAGRGEYISFPYDAFESEILRHLREVKPSDLLRSAGGDGRADAVAVAQAAADYAAEQVANIGRELAAKGFSAVLADGARHWEGELAKARADLETASANASTAADEDFGEVFRLADEFGHFVVTWIDGGAAAGLNTEAMEAMDRASLEAARVKCRAVLRRLIREVWVEIQPHREEQRFDTSTGKKLLKPKFLDGMVCTAVIHFNDSPVRRTVEITYLRGRKGRERTWYSESRDS